jgi:hypothetical protein
MQFRLEIAVRNTPLYLTVFVPQMRDWLHLILPVQQILRVYLGIVSKRMAPAKEPYAKLVRIPYL